MISVSTPGFSGNRPDNPGKSDGPGWPEPAPPPKGTPKRPPKEAWYRRTWVIGLSAVVLGVVLGAAVAGSGPTISPEARKQIDTARAAQHKALAERDQARGAQQQAESERDQARDELNAAQGDLTTRKAALDKRKSDLDAREKKITDAEKAAKANSFGGDGIYLVGTDIQAGTYKAGPSPSGNCYTEVDRDLTGDFNSIITNNNTSGPVVLQVPSSAKSIKVSGCADFHKIA